MDFPHAWPNGQVEAEFLPLVVGGEPQNELEAETGQIIDGKVPAKIQAVTGRFTDHTFRKRLFNHVLARGQFLPHSRLPRAIADFLSVMPDFQAGVVWGQQNLVPDRLDRDGAADLVVAAKFPPPK